MTSLKEWGMDFPFNEGTPQERWLYLDYTYDTGSPESPIAPPIVTILGAVDTRRQAVELTAGEQQEVAAYITANPPMSDDDFFDEGF